MKFFTIWAVAAVLLAVLVLADKRGWLMERGANLWRYHGETFRVSEVLSGHTFKIDVPGRGGLKPVVQLCGIVPQLDRGSNNNGIGSIFRRKFVPDPVLSPEESADRSQTNSSFSNSCVNHLQQLVTGQMVRLELVEHSGWDSENRLLAYVYLPDQIMLNEQLLATGWAQADNRQAHRWLERFSLIQMQAQRDRPGAWADW